ncbi:unnamed protein product [Caenorhabditis sp. 36 PRJEB53466]|nr:unnamed protein product [Caenorhabditis sp. 36 PRJEB53466]
MSSPPNTTTIVYDITTWPNALASAIMFMSAVLGIVFNFAIVYGFIKDLRQKTAFNLICFFRAANNLMYLCVGNLGVYIPITVMGSTPYPPMIETVLIIFAINLPIYNEFQGIYIAINRAVAVFTTHYYRKLFKLKFVLAFHILYYLDRIRNVTFESIDRNAASKYLLFSSQYISYGGLQVTPDGMFKIALALIIFPFLINAIIFAKLYYLKKDIQKKRVSGNLEHSQEAKQNMKLFIQTVLQDSLFSISVIFTLKLNTLVSHRFWTFFSVTYTSELVHVLDGFIMLMFNERLSLLKNVLPNRKTPNETSAKQPSVKVMSIADVAS